MRGVGSRSIWLYGLMLVVAAPAAAQVSAPSQREPYSVMVIGDSYAAGEGAPQVDGTFDDNGDLQSGGHRENWDTSDDGNPALHTETERCHRSPNAPGGVASSYLAADFPDIEVLFRSVACSGASIIEGGVYSSSNPSDSAAEGDAGGVLRPYTGVDSLEERGKTSFPSFPPQLDQIDSILDARGASSPRNRLDALIVNVGGNDAGFASFVVECGVVPFKNCANDSDLRTFRDAMLSRVDTRYGRMAVALNSNRANTLDAELSPNHVPKAVLVTAIPNVARKTATSGSPLSDYCDSEPSHDQSKFVEAAEASFIENTMRAEVNRIKRRHVLKRILAGENWRFVDAHVDDFIGHAICQEDRWINQNRDGLRKQSELDVTEGVPGAAISGGWVHPNTRGYQQVGGALYRTLADELVERFTPTQPPVVLSLRSASSFTASLGANVQVLSTTSGNYTAFKLMSVAPNGALAPVTDGNGLRLARGSISYERTGRHLLLARSCGPLSRDASIGCGPAGEARVSTLVPPTPIETGVRRVDSKVFGRKTQIHWKHAHAGASIDTRSTEVRVTHATRPLEYNKLFTINGNATVLSLSPSQLPEGDYDIRLKACNGNIGCSPVSTRVRISTSGITVSTPLSSQHVGIANYGCSNPPAIAWGIPAQVLPARDGTDGTITLTDPFGSTVPTCLHFGPVGRLSVRPGTLRARPGRTATLVAGWEHPRAWTGLRTVQIRLRSRSRVVATITFDRKRETMTLAPGSSARGKRARLGTRRTLRAGAVTLRLDRRTFRRPRKGARAVSLRLPLQLGRALAGSALAVEMSATGEDGARQAFEPGGTLRVSRR